MKKDQSFKVSDVYIIKGKGVAVLDLNKASQSVIFIERLKKIAQQISDIEIDNKKPT